jgi:hypothetical protein
MKGCAMKISVLILKKEGKDKGRFEIDGRLDPLGGILSRVNGGNKEREFWKFTQTDSAPSKTSQVALNIQPQDVHNDTC